MKRILAVGLLAVASLAACRERPQRVVIGVAVTRENHRGVELALAEINAAGGVDGVPLEALGWEWREGPPNVLEWAQRFAVTEGLVAVVGHSDSPSTLTAGAVYNQHGIPHLVTIATHPAITGLGDWTYRLCLSDAQQGPVLARYAVDAWGKKRLAVFYVNDDYGRGLAQIFERVARQRGAEIVASVFHRNVLQADDEELLRARLLELAAEPPDLLVLFQRPSAANWTLQTARELGLTSDVLGADNLSRGAFLDTGTVDKEGLRFSLFFDPQRDDPRTRRFVEAFREFTGRDPEYGEAYAYDAVYLLRDAMAHGGFSRRGVRAYLDRVIAEQTTLHGVAGPYTLGADHDARRPLVIAEVRGGRVTPLVEIPWGG